MAVIPNGENSLEVFPSPQETTMLVIQTTPVSEVGVQIWLMDKSRPRQMFLAPRVRVDSNGQHKFDHLKKWPNGIYLFQITASGKNTRIDDPLTAARFKISEGFSEPADARELECAITQQEAFRNFEIRQEEFQGENRFRLRVILGKCLLDYEQVFRGGVLTPMSNRLNLESILSVVAQLLPPGISFQETKELEDAYGRGHPLCLVTFENVQAKNCNTAIVAIQQRLRRVIGALGQNRGASPEVLAYLIEDSEQRYNLATPSNIYRGNLAAGFGPGVTDFLDIVDATADENPWIDFVLSLMSSVRRQTNPETMLFLAWSLIESAAKRSVTSEATAVLDDNGNEIPARSGRLTQRMDLGRTLVYLRDHVGRNKLGLEVGRAPGFFDQVRCAYQCRNAVAHDGGLYRPGSAPPEGYTPQFPFTVRDWASEVVRFECSNAAQTK